MKKVFILIIVIGLILVGCGKAQVNKNAEEKNSTTQKVYSSSWDGDALIVEERDENGNYEKVNEVTNIQLVKKLISILKKADWEENVDVDIEPPDFRFTWNSYEHNVWVNQEFRRLELIIVGQSNYGTLSKNSSEIVFEILTGKTFE